MNNDRSLDVRLQRFDLCPEGEERKRMFRNKFVGPLEKLEVMNLSGLRLENKTSDTRINSGHIPRICTMYGYWYCCVNLPL